MVAHLKKLDMFGVTFSLNTFGHEKFKTKLGASMTCICLTIMAVFVYFFGTDFFHKENPNVIPNSLVHLESKKIPLENEKLAFMFRLEDGNNNPFDLNKTPYRLDGSYFHLRKNSKGVTEIVCWVGGPEIIRKCSQTKAILNPDLTKVKLDEWFCWDMEAVKTKCREKLKATEPEYEPFLGGYMDEDEYTALRYDVTNHVYDYEARKITNIVPDEEYAKAIWVSVHARHPNVSYDSNSPDKPIRTYYDSIFKAVNSNTFTRIYHFMSVVTNIDDAGWVFPNRTTTQSMELDRSDAESVAQPANTVKYFYGGFFMNVKKEKLYRRNFMKIQQLAALVGGMTKSVFMVFAFYSMLKAVQERDSELRNRFYEVKCVKRTGESEFPLQQGETKVNTVVQPRELNLIDEQKIGWCAYLLSFCRKSGSEVSMQRIIEQMNRHMFEKFDVTYLIKHLEEFRLLKEMLCTEEQRELLEKHKTEVEAEA